MRMVPWIEGEPTESGAYAIAFLGSKSEVAVELAVAQTQTLASVEVQPMMVRGALGSGGPQSTGEEIRKKFARFGSVLSQSCNLSLSVAEPVEIHVAGFETFAKHQMQELDDEAIGAAAREATGELVGGLVSQGLRPFFEAADEVANPAVVRAFVFGMYESPETAKGWPRALFHSDQRASLGFSAYYSRFEPIYEFDPALPILDESVDPPMFAQALRRLNSDETARLSALYFGDDHTEAFAHELGHVLGLPHPMDSSVIASGPGPGGAPNVMDNADECLPDCSWFITPHQCEIMLSGLTGYAHPSP